MSEVMINILDPINLKNKTICITGANGFIGRRLIEGLSLIGCRIKVLTRKKDSKFPANIDIYFGDLTNPELHLKYFIEGCDLLFHCAGEINNELQMSSLHINGTQLLINAVHEEFFSSKKKIHWIQLSSCGAYGPPQDIQMRRVVTESSDTNPINQYEKTKTMSDELVITASSNIFFYTILRPSNIIGASMSNQSIRKLINWVKSGYFFFIGKKDSIATYIHVDDVINAMLLIAINPKSRNEIFIVSNDCTWEDLLLKISSLLNVKIMPFRIPFILIQAPLYILKSTIGKFFYFPQFAIFAFRTTYCTKKIERYLNFKFTRPMPGSIKDVIDNMNIG